MKIINSETRDEQHSINTITYDNGIEAVQHMIGGKQDSLRFSYPADKDLYPMFFDSDFLSPEKLNDWKGFDDFIHDNRKDIEDLGYVNNYTPYLVYYSGHVLFDINRRPITLPVSFDYCGSLHQNKRTDTYDKLITLLKKHEWIKRLEEKEIEYYNSQFGGQRGIKKCVAMVSQEAYEALYEHFKGHQFWCVRMKEIIKLSYNNPEYNLYGDEITALLVKHWSEK